MKFEIIMNRERNLELFGKLIRTKKIENLQGDQQRRSHEPAGSNDTKQKLQVNT